MLTDADNRKKRCNLYTQRDTTATSQTLINTYRLLLKYRSLTSFNLTAYMDKLCITNITQTHENVVSTNIHVFSTNLRKQNYFFLAKQFYSVRFKFFI